MANTKLSALSTGSAIADADLFYSSQGGASVKQPATAFATYLVQSQFRFGVLPSSGGGAPANAGTGYVQGERITLAGGTSTVAAVIVVNAVDGGGAITKHSVVTCGYYTVIPANNVAQASTSGSGTGATFTLKWGPIAATIDGAPLAAGGNFTLGGNSSEGLGVQAGGAIAGVENTLIGDKAGAILRSGDSNTCLGHGALGVGTGGALIDSSNNIAIGADSLRNYNSNGSNVAVGTSCMKFLTTGNGNIGIGNNVLGSASFNGSFNMFVGGGGALTTGGSNVGMGIQAGDNQTTGSSFVAIGAKAGQGQSGATAGSFVAIGNEAFLNATSGNGTYIGWHAGHAVANGTQNTIIGGAAGASIIAGNSNICIGDSVDTPSASDVSSTINIGNIWKATGIGTPSTSVTTIAGLTTLTGAATPTGGIAAAGGFAVSPRLCHTGDNPVSASTDFTDYTVVNTEVLIAEVFVPANVTLTGVAIFNGSAVAGNVKVGLANSSGAVVATSASTAQSGTDAYQRVAFTGTYAAVGPATYYVLAMGDTNGGTSKINTHTVGNFGAAKQTGQVYATGFTTVTPPTTFTTALGVVASLY